MTSKGAMKMHPKANELRFVTKNDGYVHVHPSSVNYTVRNHRPSQLLQELGVKATIVVTFRSATTTARTWFTTRR